MNVAVMASGSGTILEAMLDAAVPVSLVVVDRPCRASRVAHDNDIAALDLHRTEWDASFDRAAFTKGLTSALMKNRIDLVVMAGFGTILGPPIYEVFAGRILNTHPSLLPAFPGWHAVDAALAYGVKISGCTVHIATLEVDAGPILAQEAVPVRAEDTVDTLHERIKIVERRLYVDTVTDVLARGWVLPDPAAPPGRASTQPTEPTELSQQKGES